MNITAQFFNNFILLLPIFLIIGVGYILQKKKFITEEFLDKTSKLVFWLCLPIMLFQKVANISITDEINWYVVISSIVVLFGVFLLSMLIGKLAGLNPARLGSFSQGSFRSNCLIVGLAVIINVFPEKADIMAGRAAVFFTFYVPAINVFAVMALTLPQKNAGNFFAIIKKTIIKVFSNPLIIACILGMIFSYFKISIPSPINKTFTFFGKMTFPLALLSVGGILSFRKISKDIKPVSAVIFLKLFLLPFLSLITFKYFGVEGDMLKLYVIVTGAPTAVASFIMARAMKADSSLASSIVMATTLFSIFSLTFWLTVVS